MIQPNFSELDYYKEQPQKESNNSKAPTQKVAQRGSLPPKASKTKILGNYDSKTTNTKSIAKQ